MTVTRATKETLYLRRDFTPAERLEMGRDLAQAHNRLAAIDDEEKSMKATIKEKKAGVELTVGSLSRRLNDGYEMENQVCSLTYDEPNVGEVTYRDPTGAIVKQRAMTINERQEELPFDESGNGPVKVVPPEESAANIDKFFEKKDEIEDPIEECENCRAEVVASLMRETDDSVILCPACWKEFCEVDQADADASASNEAHVVTQEAEKLPDNFEEGVRQSMGVPESFPATLAEQIEKSETVQTSKPGRGKPKLGKDTPAAAVQPIDEAW